jgi:hypothetical protein
MQSIEESGDEVVLERSAAIDVAKGSGKVCVRLPNPSGAGRRQTKVWDVASRTGAIAELADELAELDLPPTWSHPELRTRSGQFVGLPCPRAATGVRAPPGSLN